MTKPICIYHGGCDDGFGAAYAVWKRFGDAWEYYPGVYQAAPPDVTGRDVVLVDFSYRRAVLEDMIRVANSVLILDHHQSAELDLIGIEGFGASIGKQVTAIFSHTESGAMMAWKHFHKSAPPGLIEHIQDRDLWTFKLEGTRDISAGLRAYPQDFEIWHNFGDNDQLEWLRIEGRAINRWYDNQIKQMQKRLIRMNIAGVMVNVANAPYAFASDLAGALAVGQPFGAVFYMGPDGVSFSLRSDDEGMDVSVVAATYGGGGHKHAAGFRVANLTALNIVDLGDVPQ